MYSEALYSKKPQWYYIEDYSSCKVASESAHHME